MDLAELIAEYIKAKTKLDQLKSDCDSSWGYYLHDEIERVNELSRRIDAKVKELSRK